MQESFILTWEIVERNQILLSNNISVNFLAIAIDTDTVLNLFSI